MKEKIQKLSKGHSLTFDESKSAMNMILENRVSAAQAAAYLTALHIKGESIEEITGSVLSVKEHTEKVNYMHESLQLVSTGWDMSNSFTISVGAAIVAAAGGCKVARYGNRSTISKCGLADVIEALGINIRCSSEESIQMLDKSGFCFLYAPKYHSAMKYMIPVRVEIGIRTIFDILGPLANPVFSDIQLVGVYDDEFLKPMAQVLINIGVKRGMSVHGLDGVDEISASAPTKVCELTDGRIKSYTIKPEDFGFISCTANELKAGSSEECAEVIRKVFSGNEKGGRYNAICMNGGAALYLQEMAGSLAEGIALAKDIIDSGKAEEKLEEIVVLSKQTSGA